VAPGIPLSRSVTHIGEHALIRRVAWDIGQDEIR
jgi:hypothetical protein